MDKLPDEIILHIFTLGCQVETTFDQRIGFSSPSFLRDKVSTSPTSLVHSLPRTGALRYRRELPEFACTASLVCVHWSKLVRSTRRLWVLTVMLASHTKEAMSADVLAKTMKVIRQPGGCTLDITVVFYIDNDAVFKLFQDFLQDIWKQHSNQVRSIMVGGSEESFRQNVTHTILQNGCPSLQHLEVAVTGSDKNINESGPTIPQLPPTHPSSFCSLTSLTIPRGIVTLLSVDRPLNFKALSYLSMQYFYVEEVIRFFESVHAPRLENLTISILKKKPRIPPKSRRILLHVVSLKLLIHCSVDESFPLLSSFDFIALRIVGIVCFRAPPTNFSYRNVGFNEPESWFRLYMPMLRSLSLRPSNNLSSLIDLLSLFAQIRTIEELDAEQLTALTRVDFPYPSASRLLRRVETLWLYCASFAGKMSRARCGEFAAVTDIRLRLDQLPQNKDVVFLNLDFLTGDPTDERRENQELLWPRLRQVTIVVVEPCADDDSRLDTILSMVDTAIAHRYGPTPVQCVVGRMLGSAWHTLRQSELPVV